MSFWILFLRWAVGLLLACASASAAARELTIVVKPSVEVANLQRVALADLVVNPEGLPQTAMLAQALDVTQASRNRERSLVLTAKQVEVMLASYISAIESEGKAPSLRVPERVQIVERISRDSVRTSLLRALEPLCAECEIQIHNIGFPSAVLEATHWQISPPAELPRGEFSVQLITIDTNGQRRAHWITGSLSVHRSVYVALRALQVGEAPQEKDVRLERRETTFMAGQPATLSEIRSASLLRPVQSGQILFSGALKRELAVRTGQPVKAVMNGASWSITTDAVAQSSGYVGDLIRARINRSSRIVSGRINADGQLEVQ